MSYWASQILGNLKGDLKFCSPFLWAFELFGAADYLGDLWSYSCLLGGSEKAETLLFENITRQTCACFSTEFKSENCHFLQEFFSEKTSFSSQFLTILVISELMTKSSRNSRKKTGKETNLNPQKANSM